MSFLRLYLFGRCAYKYLILGYISCRFFSTVFWISGQFQLNILRYMFSYKYQKNSFEISEQMWKSGFFLSGRILVGTRHFQVKSGDSRRNLDGWTVCQRATVRTCLFFVLLSGITCKSSVLHWPVTSTTTSARFIRARFIHFLFYSQKQKKPNYDLSSRFLFKILLIQNSVLCKTHRSFYQILS